MQKEPGLLAGGRAAVPSGGTSYVKDDVCRSETEGRGPLTPCASCAVLSRQACCQCRWRCRQHASPRSNVVAPRATGRWMRGASRLVLRPFDEQGADQDSLQRLKLDARCSGGGANAVLSRW